MVLDAGRLVRWSAPLVLNSPLNFFQVEFASPSELLQIEKSFFRALVEESADKEALYGMTYGKKED